MFQWDFDMAMVSVKASRHHCRRAGFSPDNVSRWERAIKSTRHLFPEESAASEEFKSELEELEKIKKEIS